MYNRIERRDVLDSRGDPIKATTSVEADPDFFGLAHYTLLVF